jgi:hypothetical protein
METSTEERRMWESIDRTIPRLRRLVGEMRSRGEDFTADEVMGIADDLAGSRPQHVAGRVQRTHAKA